jgi:hypothetical protein
MKPGDVISYVEMSHEEGLNLQRGMNFRLRGGYSVILMSLRVGAPYADRVENDGRILNGLFFQAAQEYKNGRADAELVKVYEKIREGIWVYNGVFNLIDAWQEASGVRNVFKFKLELSSHTESQAAPFGMGEIDHDRVIPSSVKLEVWKRDKGRCVQCGSQINLHFDHIIPFSKGGSSLVQENIQLLCAKHNLAKHDHIE